MSNIITPATLRKMADQLEAAQQKVLSKFGLDDTATPTAKPRKGRKKGMSAAAKAKLSKAAKARWAARRKEGKTSL